MQDNSPNEHQPHPQQEEARQEEPHELAEEDESNPNQIQFEDNADEAAEEGEPDPLEQNQNAEALDVEEQEEQQPQEDQAQEYEDHNQENEDGVEIHGLQDGEEAQREVIHAEEQASSNSPPLYEPDLIDDEAEDVANYEDEIIEQATHELQQAIMKETNLEGQKSQQEQELHKPILQEENVNQEQDQEEYVELNQEIQANNQEQAQYEAEFIEDLKIEYEKQSQSQISHVYAEQELIEEWRDQEVQLHYQDLHVEDYIKNEDYNFAGVNDYEEEVIEPQQKKPVGDTAAEEQRLPEQIEQESRQIQINNSVAQKQHPPRAAVEPKTSKSQVVHKTQQIMPPAPVHASNFEGNKQAPNKQIDVRVKPVNKVSNLKPTNPKKVPPTQQTSKENQKVEIKGEAEVKGKEGSFKKIKPSQKQPQASVISMPASKVEEKETPKVPQNSLKKQSDVVGNPQQASIAKAATVGRTTVKQRSEKDGDTKKESNLSFQNRDLAQRERQALLDKKKLEELQKQQLFLQNQKRKEEQREWQKQRQRKENERRQKERLQTEQIQKQILQRQRLQKQKLQRDRLERERVERQRIQRQRIQRQGIQKQRLKRQKQDKERLEMERLGREKQRREAQQRQKEQRKVLLSQQREHQVKEEGIPAVSSHIKVTKKKKKKKANPSSSKSQARNEPQSRQLPLRPIQHPNPSDGSNNPNDDNHSQNRSLHSALHSERDHASEVNSEIDPSEPDRPEGRNIVAEIMNSESLSAVNQPKQPVLTSLIVVREAEKERVGTTYKMFLKYNYEYERTVATYKRIVRNVCTELQAKKQNKRPLQRMLEDYFEDFGKLCKEFNERCYKTEVESEGMAPTKNTFASLRLQLKKGFDEMVFLRKSVANNSNRLSALVSGTVLPQIRKAFESYYASIAQEEGRQLQRRDEHARREKQLRRVVAQAEKNFNRGLEGKVKDDLFVEITRFINEEKLHRAALRNFGRGVVELRQTYMRCEKELFDRLQESINRFKFESQGSYSFWGRELQFTEMVDYTRQIKERSRFCELCTLVDLDYVKYVLELESKQEKEQFSNRDFESYLELVFFDRVVGNIRGMLKGATNKVFPMQADGDELVHSISGNLLLFHRPHDLCRDQFAIANLNAKLVGSGFVEFDELQKGIFFDESRTVRLKLRDDDRAEELICYLNEKEEDIVLGQQ